MGGAVSLKIGEQPLDAAGLGLCWREAEGVLIQQLPLSAAESEENRMFGWRGRGGRWCFEAVLESRRSGRPHWPRKQEKYEDEDAWAVVRAHVGLVSLHSSNPSRLAVDSAGRSDTQKADGRLLPELGLC